MKVLVAMSGGVDSSVAAALLAREGHDVTGVHLKLAAETRARGERAHGCCSVEDADDARRVAQTLGIPFYVWNMAEVFSAAVVEDFVGEYARGRTPNPCVRCNERVKFGALLERARALGFDAVATGHYAVLRRDGERVRLFRSADRAKDQSYVLARVTAAELRHAMFPVGGLTKEQTREIARSLSLRTADKPESYDICFVPGDTATFVESALGGARPGPIVDAADGRVLGAHGGVHRYTVGQRKGLGLGIAEKRYVIEVDAARNAVVVGVEEMLARGGLAASDVRWIAGGAPARIDAVQIRAHGEPIPAHLADATGDEAVVRFERPARAVAPGQLVAFYAGDEVLGGGTIERALR